MSIPTRELIRRFNIPGPCYTTYPTANRFVEAFTSEQLAQELSQRRNVAAAMQRPLSLYLQIPFGQSPYHHCTCQKTIATQHGHGETYLRHLGRELDLYAAHLGSAQTAGQLNLGGGSPTFLNDGELNQLMATLRRSFRFAPGADYSIEIDPRTMDSARLVTLAELGFNRLSFGVQDFNPAVQKAFHCSQSAEPIFSMMAAARLIGFESVSMDLIYGLPQQTPQSFAGSLAQVVQLRPDCVALHAYAHLPQRFKPQRRNDAAELPDALARLSMQLHAFSAFQAAGYVHIGMDQFALPEHALAVAKRQGRLHRNSQGYSFQPEGDLIGLGVCAIGKLGATYTQNAKTLDAYYDDLQQGRLPVARGLALSRDDLVRRSAIMALVCQGQLDFESIELGYLIDFKSYFAAELEMLCGLEQQGLVEVSDTGLQVTAMGVYFVRSAAMVFDRYLQADRTRAMFSRII